MQVLFVAAEAAPYVKTGGLADVAGALPPALRTAGHDVRLVMPRYRELREKGTLMTGPVAAAFLPLGEESHELRVWKSRDAGPAYFLDIPAAFERAAIYGESDDHRRFILFARGVVTLLQHLREVEGWQPDVVHCHDWHSALVINYLRTRYRYTFGHLATVFTIHNLAYQGQVHPGTLALAGLSEYGLIENGMGAGIAGTFNCMARGIQYADIVTTVSPTYASEIRTAEYGARLDPLLRWRGDRVVGILNGIDTDAYDPASDRHLTAHYHAGSAQAKGACKAALQRETGLAVEPSRPLLGVVSRLVSQKGLDLLLAAMPWLIGQTDAQIVILGSGEAALQNAFRALGQRHADRVAVKIGFDAALAQRVYAGSDMFLMPSRFEPCGLGQLIALRYGSVPIVRATGGLADTVSEGWDGNGFRFHPYETRYFTDAIGRALLAYRDHTGWTQLRARGMNEDHSWTRAAAAYGAVYQRATAIVRG
jgi:starch synthase